MSQQSMCWLAAPDQSSSLQSLLKPSKHRQIFACCSRACSKQYIIRATPTVAPSPSSSSSSSNKKDSGMTIVEVSDDEDKPKVERKKRAKEPSPSLRPAVAPTATTPPLRATPTTTTTSNSSSSSAKPASPSLTPLGPPPKRSRVVDPPSSTAAAAATTTTPTTETKVPLASVEPAASSSSSAATSSSSAPSGAVRCMVEGCNGHEGSRAPRAEETIEQGVQRIQSHYAWMLTNAPTQAADDGAHRKALLSLHRMLRSPTTCPGTYSYVIVVGYRFFPLSTLLLWIV
jgi:hypothetical protein